MDHNNDIDNIMLSLESLEKMHTALVGQGTLSRTLAFETYNDNVVDAYMTKGGSEAYRVALEEISSGMIAALIAFFIAIAAAIAKVFGGGSSGGGGGGGADSYREVVNTTTFSSKGPSANFSSSDFNTISDKISKLLNSSNVNLFLNGPDKDYLKAVTEVSHNAIAPTILDLEHSLNESISKVKTLVRANNTGEIIEVAKCIMSDADRKDIETFRTNAGIQPNIETDDGSGKNTVNKLSASATQRLMAALVPVELHLMASFEKYAAINGKLFARGEEISDLCEKLAADLEKQEKTLTVSDPLFVFAKEAGKVFRLILMTLKSAEKFIETLMKYLLKVREIFVAIGIATGNPEIESMKKSVNDLRDEIKRNSQHA